MATSQTVTKLEYLWVDGHGLPRSKTRLVPGVVHKVSDCPEWNFDGSSTGQAPGSDSEVIVRPQVLYPDPFRRENVAAESCHWLVLCDTWGPDGQPHKSNTRWGAMQIFNTFAEEIPWFGIEQEFFLTQKGWPLGFPQDQGRGLCWPQPQGHYYCGVGGDHAFGRGCIEEIFDHAIYAGISLTGMNAEVAPGQWEFQVREEGISCADQLTVLRYIILRTTEKYGWDADFHPKPIKGDWNGSGCHVNYSTKAMREEGGYTVIQDAVKRLAQKHKEHMEVYGQGNR